MAAAATPLEVLEALPAAFSHGTAIQLCREGAELKWRLKGYRYKTIDDDFFRVISARFDMLFAGEVDDSVNMNGAAVIGNKSVSRDAIIQALEHIIPN